MMKYTWQLALLCSFILHVQSLNSNIVERRNQAHSSAGVSTLVTPNFLSRIYRSLPLQLYKSYTFGFSDDSQSIGASSTANSLSTIHSGLPFNSYISHTYGPSVASHSEIENGAIHAALYRVPEPSISISPAHIIQLAKSSQQQQQQVSAISRAAAVVPAQPSVVVVAKPVTPPIDPKDMRMRDCYEDGQKVTFSNYWIPKENEWDVTDDDERVYLGGNVKVRLSDKNNQELGWVPVDMYPRCKMEGTCLLENGDLINIDNTTNTFIKVGRAGREHNVFGLGAGAQNLVPFVSVAANDIPLGQTLYIKELDGQDLGYGMEHNGCVRVDDDSWSFDGCQIDFFVLSYVDYLWLDLDDEVSIEYANCQVKNYITMQHLHYAKASNNEKIIPSLLNDKYVKIK